MENILDREEIFTESSAEFTVQCSTLYGEPETHRVFIQRDGSVYTPDHVSEPEDIMEALGGFVDNPCTHWKIASKGDPLLGHEVQPIDVANCEFQRITTTWTSKATWSALTAMLGKNTYKPFDPVKILNYLKTYAKHGITVDEQRRIITPTVLETLLSPPTRNAGFRRSDEVTAEELDSVLNTGVTVSLIPQIFSLGFSTATVEEALTQSLRLNIRIETIVNLAELFTPEHTVHILQRMNKQQAQHITEKLVLLSVKGYILTVDDLEKIFLK